MRIVNTLPLLFVSALAAAGIARADDATAVPAGGPSMQNMQSNMQSNMQNYQSMTPEQQQARRQQMRSAMQQRMQGMRSRMQSQEQGGMSTNGVGGAGTRMMGGSPGGVGR